MLANVVDKEQEDQDTLDAIAQVDFYKKTQWRAPSLSDRAPAELMSFKRDSSVKWSGKANMYD